MHIVSLVEALPTPEMTTFLYSSLRSILGPYGTKSAIYKKDVLLLLILLLFIIIAKLFQICLLLNVKTNQKF